MKKEKLEIGDILYKYVVCGGIFSYKVIGIRAYADLTAYELESQSCTHHWNCKILVGGKIDNLQFIEMLNDHEDDPQHYWHDNDTKFRFTKEQAEIDLLNKNISIVKENVSQAEDRLKREKESLKRYEELAKIAKEKLNANIPTLS